MREPIRTAEDYRKAKQELEERSKRILEDAIERSKRIRQETIERSARISRNKKRGKNVR